jgi:hypothetical protein
VRSEQVTSPLTKTELRLTETDRAARAIIADERARHIAKTAKLREIRLTQKKAAETKPPEARRRAKAG